MTQSSINLRMQNYTSFCNNTLLISCHNLTKIFPFLIQHHKTFFIVTYEWAKYARVFVPGKLFQPSVMFASKARSLPVSCSTPDLLVNIRLWWLWLTGSSFLRKGINYSRKKCYTTDPISMHYNSFCYCKLHMS